MPVRSIRTYAPGEFKGGGWVARFVSAEVAKAAQEKQERPEATPAAETTVEDPGKEAGQENT